MVRKTNKSPLNQIWGGGSIIGSLVNQAKVPTTNPNTFNGSLMGMPVGNINTNNSQQNTNTGGFFGNLNIDTSGMLGNARKLLAEKKLKASETFAPTPSFSQKSAAIAAKKAQRMNPKATGNNAVVKNVFGQEQVPGSYDRSMSPLTQTQEIDPIYPPTTPSQPLPPPADIQQAITPTYDLSNI